MQGGKAVCSKLFNNSKPLRKNRRGLPEKYAEIKNQLFSSRIEVQCGQRVASMAISDRQYGHFLVVGAAGASSCLPSEAALFMSLMSANSTIAMMKKLMTAVMKEPYLMFTPPKFETYGINIVQYLANIVNYICAKSEKTDARIGHPLQVIRTTRNRQK